MGVSGQRLGNGRALPPTFDLLTHAQRLRRAVAAASASVALALAVSACGGSGSGSGASPTATSGPVASSSSASSGVGSTGTASQGTTAGSTTTTTAAGSTKVAACSTNDLRFLFDRTTGAAGTVLLLFSVRNATAQPCTVAGYFGLSLYSTTGRRLTGTDYGEAETPGGMQARSETVTLKPGSEATTATRFSDNAPTGSGITCTKVAAAQLIPPNQTGHATVPIPRPSQPLFCGPARASIDVFVTRPGPPPTNYR